MRSRVQILRPQADIPAPDPWGDQPEPVDPVLVDDVPARIYAMRNENAQAPSGQTNDQQQYRVQCPARSDLDLKVKQTRIRVHSNPNAPELEGRVLTIDAVLHSSERFNIDLVCSEHVTQQQG